MAFVLHDQQESKALKLRGVNLYSKIMGRRPNISPNYRLRATSVEDGYEIVG